MTRSAVWSLVVIATFVLGACATSQPASTDGGTGGTGGTIKTIDTSKPTGLLIEPVEAHKLGYAIDWVTHLNLPKGHTVESVTTLGDIVVTIERPSNMVTAISNTTGRQLWRQQVGQSPYNAFTPSRLENRLLINTETQLFELDIANEGRMLGRFELPSAVGTSSALVGDTAIFGGADGMVFGMNTRSGFPAWRYKMPGQILVPAQAAGQAVFVVGIDGQYALIMGTTGELIWRGRVFDKVTATPAIHSTGIYVASEDHSLYAISRAGEDRWIYRYIDDLVESPIILQNTVYQPLPSGELVALKVTDGSPVWQIKTNDKLISQSTRGLIFNAGDKLTIRDPNSGKLLNEIPVAGKLAHVTASDGNSLIVVSTTGRVLKLSHAK